MDWIAFYELEPWGDSLNGARAATTTAAVLNAGLMQASPSQLKKKPFKPEDFWIGVNNQSTKRKSTWQDQRAKLDVLVSPKKGHYNESRKFNSGLKS